MREETKQQEFAAKIAEFEALKAQATIVSFIIFVIACPLLKCQFAIFNFSFSQYMLFLNSYIILGIFVFMVHVIYFYYICFLYKKNRYVSFLLLTVTRSILFKSVSL